MGAQIFAKDDGGESIQHRDAIPSARQTESALPGEPDNDHVHEAGGPEDYDDPSESFGKAAGKEFRVGSYTVGQIGPAGFGNGDLEGPQRHDLALVRTMFLAQMVSHM